MKYAVTETRTFNVDFPGERKHMTVQVQISDTVKAFKYRMVIWRPHGPEYSSWMGDTWMRSPLSGLLLFKEFGFAFEEWEGIFPTEKLFRIVTANIREIKSTPSQKGKAHDDEGTKGKDQRRSKKGLGKEEDGTTPQETARSRKAKGKGSRIGQGYSYG